MLDGLVDGMKKELKQVKKREQRLNTQNQEQVVFIKQ